MSSMLLEAIRELMVKHKFNEYTLVAEPCYSGFKMDCMWNDDTQK